MLQGTPLPKFSLLVSTCTGTWSVRWRLKERFWGTVGDDRSTQQRSIRELPMNYVSEPARVMHERGRWPRMTRMQLLWLLSCWVVVCDFVVSSIFVSSSPPSPRFEILILHWLPSSKVLVPYGCKDNPWFLSRCECFDADYLSSIPWKAHTIRYVAGFMTQTVISSRQEDFDVQLVFQNRSCW